MSHRIVVFEEIHKYSRYLVKWYRARGCKIYFLRVNKLCVDKEWFTRYLRDGLIQKINFGGLHDNLTYYCPDGAHKNTELIYNVCFKNHLLIQKLIFLFRDNHIALAYKKYLLQRLSFFYHLNRIINMLNAKFKDDRVIFMSSNGIDVYRTDGREVYDYLKLEGLAKIAGADFFDRGNVVFPVFSIACSYVKAIMQKIAVIIQTILLILFLTIGKISIFFTAKHSSNLKKKYKYGVMVISPRRQFGNGTQKISFLIDGVAIKKEETVFISYTKIKRKYVNLLKSNGLAYIDNLSGFLFFGRRLFKAKLSCFPFLLLIKETVLISDISLKLVYHYLIWNNFTDIFHIGALITYCDFGIQTIARNIILKQDNVKTYYYMDSSNFGCFCSKVGSDEKYLHGNFSFLYYDYLISWNRKAIEYFKDCKSEFENYSDFGCLWSEHLRELTMNMAKSELMLQLYESRCVCNDYKDGMKLVAVFDSTFHDDSMTTYQDGIDFLTNILKLLNDLPDIFVVMKEKKSRSYHMAMTSESDKILGVYDKLDSHPRYLSLKGGEEGWRSSSEIIALCDLTIAFPFVSTVFEAVSARKRAIWHDASGKFLGAFYDSVPDLVTHNYSELLTRVKTLLYFLSDGDYEDYLNAYIKGKMESYLDGLGISRFRNLLVKNTV